MIIFVGSKTPTMNEKYEEIVKNAVSNGYSLERFQEILSKANFPESDINSLSEAYTLKKKGTTPSESPEAQGSMDSTSSSVDADSSLASPLDATSQGGDYAQGFKQQEILKGIASLDVTSEVATPWSTIKEEEDYHRANNNQEAVIDVARKRKELLDGLNRELENAVTPGQKLAIGARMDEVNKEYTNLTGDKNPIINENGNTIDESRQNLTNEFQRTAYEVYDDVMEKAETRSEDLDLQGASNSYILSMVQSIGNQGKALSLAWQDLDAKEGSLDMDFQDLRYDQQIEQIANLYRIGIDKERLQTSATEDLFVQDEDGNLNVGDGLKKVGLGVAQTIPQIAFTILAPEVALPVMGAASGASTWVDVRDRADLNKAQKVSLAVIAGASEYAFERIGIGEINKARRSLGLIDDIPKSTRLRMAKDWITEKNQLAGAFVNSRAGSALGSATAEGLEELGVSITNQVAAHAIAGDEFNGYEIADSFMIGFAAGGGTATVPATLAAGFSAVGSTPFLKDRVKIVNDIKKYKDLASNPNLSKSERKELELELERSNLELKELVNKEEKFYASMNEQDQMDILSLNQKIRSKIDLHAKMKSQEGKDKIMRDVQGLLKEKTEIEKTYGDPFSIVENEDGKVQRKPYKDRKRAEKLNAMLNELGLGQVEETAETLAESTVEFTEDTNLDELVNEFMGDITDAQLTKYGTSRTEIRQALKETRNMFSALKGINPDSKIFIHKTPKAFESATGESALDASGIFLPKESNKNEIHLFAPALAAGTAIHEVGHEIAGQMGGGFIQEFMKGMSDAVQGDSFLSERYGSFLKGYVEEGADLSEIQEEFFAEFLQDLARGNVSVEVEKSLLNKLRGVINKYAGTDLKITDERSTLIEAISRMGEKIARGEDILDEALLATVALEDGMGVAMVNANESDVVGKKKKRQIITSDDVETYSFKDVVDRVNGRVLLITSDNTGVGNVDGNELYGGLLYSFLPENVRDGVGFASVDQKSVSSVMKFVETIGPEGQDVAVFVMQQSPSAMLGNYYGFKYFLDAVASSVPKEQTREILDDFKKSIVGKKDVIAAVKSKLPTLESLPDAAQKDVDYTQYGNWKKGAEVTFNKFIETIDSIDELTPENISVLMDSTSFKFRKAIVEFLLPKGYGIEKGVLSIKKPEAGKGVPLLKQAVAKAGFSQFDFYSKYSQPEFAQPEELIAQLNQGQKGDWGYIYSGFITNKNLDSGKSFQDASGVVHPQFNAKIPSNENFLLDSGYQIDDKFKDVLGYRASEKKPNFARVSIAGSMFMGSPTKESQSSVVTMANSLLGGEKEGLTTQSVIKSTAKKRKRVQENKAQPSKEGTWFVSRDFESVMNEFPDLYKESLDADIDKDKFIKENNVISIFHGGLAFSGGKPKKPTEMSFYASSEQSEAKLYAEMEEGEKASVVEIFISENDVVDEDVLFDIMIDMDLRPELYPETIANEGYASEWLDPRNNDFYALSKADRSRLFKEVSKRGIKAIKIRDGRNEKSPKYPADVTNYIIVDPSVDANTSIEDFADAKGINLESYMSAEASGTGNETQVTTNNGTYQKMINYFKSIDENFKKKTFADINGGLGTSNQLKYENDIDNYQVIEPFYDRKRFPVYSMTMEDANKAVKLLGLNESDKPHGELNKYVKKNEEHFTRFETLVKKGKLPSSKLKPDYVEQNGYDIPSESIDYAMSNAVLNVIPGDIRQDVTLNFGRSLKVGGVGLLSTRGTDVATNKSNVSLSEDPLEFYVASKYTYQKGFTPNELQAYVQDVLGPDFEVERYNKLSGPAVIIKRIDNTQDLESKFVFQNEGKLKAKKRLNVSNIGFVSNSVSSYIESSLKKQGYTVDVPYKNPSDRSIYRYIWARKGRLDQKVIALRVSDHPQRERGSIYMSEAFRKPTVGDPFFKQFKNDAGFDAPSDVMIFNMYDSNSYGFAMRKLEEEGLVPAGARNFVLSRKAVLEGFIDSFASLPEEGREKAFENMIYDLGFDRATAKEFTKQVSNEFGKEVSTQEGFGRVIMANIFQATKKNNNVLLDKFFGDIEESLRAGKDLQDVMDKYLEDIQKGATKEEVSVRMQKVLRGLEKSYIDRQSNVKRLVGEANMEAVEDLIITRAGAGAWSKVQFNKFEKEIYSGLNSEQLEGLDKLIFAMRVIQVDSNFDSREKERPKHPLGFTKEKAEASIKALKFELGSEMVNELERRANVYFESMRSLFEEAYQEGLVTTEAYEALKNDNYSPRKFLNFVLNPEDGTFKNSDSTSKDFLGELKEGSEASLIMDSRYLLQVHTRNTQNKIFYNRMVFNLAEQIEGKDLDWIMPSNVKEVEIGEPVDLSEPGEESFMYQPTDEKVAKPEKGYKNLYYFQGGRLKALQIKEEYYSELLDLEVLAKSSSSFGRGAEKTLGALNSVLRFNATGAGNPLFFMKDFFRNWLYAIFRSDVYGRSSFTVSSALMMKDLYSATKDKVLGRKDYIDLAKHGGLMDFLAIESSPFKNLVYRKGDSMGFVKRGIQKTTTGLTYLSETTEVAFRVAIYKRDLKQRIQDYIADNGNEPTQDELEALKFSAARASREILDFSQGGLASKKLDKLLVPYLNVAVQGTRGILQSMRKDPAKFIRFMGELGTIAAAITYLRLSIDDEEDDQNIPEYDKRKNFIFWTGETDEEGKRQYIRIPKAEQLSGFLRVFEIMMEKQIKGEGAFKDWTADDWKAIGQSFSMFVPVSDVGSFVPAWAQSLIAYGWNYDMFRDQVISYDLGDVLPQDEGVDSERIEYFYKALGSAIGASPSRMKAAVEKMTTTPNNSIVVSLAYGIADVLAYGTVDLGDEIKAKSNKSSAYQLIKALNPKERFIKESNPKLKMYEEDIRAKELRMEEGSKMKLLKISVEKYVDELINGTMSRADIIREVEALTDEQDLRNAAVRFITKTAQRKDLGITSQHWDVYSARSAEEQALYLVKHFKDEESIGLEVKKMRQAIGFRPARELEKEVLILLNNR